MQRYRLAWLLSLRWFLAGVATAFVYLDSGFASSGGMSLGEALAILRVMPGRDYLICVEALDHPGDHKRFLRRSVTAIRDGAEAPKVDDVIDWLGENGVSYERHESLLLLLDDELTSVSDNPMDVEVPKMDVEARPDKIIAEIAKVSGVGILTGARAGRFGADDRVVNFTTEETETLRKVMVKLSLEERLEWTAEVTPVSRTVRPTDSETVLLSSPNGFMICDIID